MLSSEARRTNFIVFDLTPLGLKATNYYTRGKRADRYTTGEVL